MNAPALVKQSTLVNDLADVIGQQNVMRLCERLGGTKIYVPRTIAPAHPIAQAIGIKPAAHLAEHYFGTAIDLPKAHFRRAQVLEYARSGQMTVAEAARACDYTERRVYQLLAESREDDAQLDLFG